MGKDCLMKQASTHLMLALPLALLAGCSATSDDTGSDRFAVSVRRALASNSSRAPFTHAAIPRYSGKEGRTCLGWSSTGSMAFPRFAHTATLMLNGKVLVAGGDSSPRTAELYTP
jgi:hypothetical protein